MDQTPIAERAVLITVIVEVLESQGERPFIFAGNVAESRIQESRSITVPVDGAAAPVVDQLMLLVGNVGRAVDAAYPTHDPVAAAARARPRGPR